MMKKSAFLLILALATFALSGCINVETVDRSKLNGQELALSGTSIAHVNLRNNGIYLFNLPLISGSVNHIGAPTLFQNTVDASACAPVLARHAKEIGGSKVFDVASQYEEFGFIIFSRSLNMSGNVIK